MINPEPDLRQRAFTEEEPTEAHYWVFNFRDGKRQAFYRTEMHEYLRFVALYGRPKEVRWRKAEGETRDYFTEEVVNG